MSHDPTYRIDAFAKLTGVTPKALRLYDRLGLVKPSRSEAGYRVYEPRHRRQLTYLLLLKRAGMPLAEVRRLLDDRQTNWAAALAAHRQRLEQRRRDLEQAFASLETLDAYFTFPLKVPQRASPARLRLYADARACLGLDPGNGEVQALVERWFEIRRFESGGDAEVLRTMRDSFRGRATWPLSARQWTAAIHDMDLETWERVADLLERGEQVRLTQPARNA